jgi:hypothetical protein
MIKAILTIALIAGGVFAFNVLQQIHKDNPEILAELNQTWQEVVSSGNHAGASSTSNQIIQGGRGDCPSIAAIRPGANVSGRRNTGRPDVGARPYRPNVNTLPTRHNNNQTNDLATAWKQWRQAVVNHQAAMRANRNGGQGNEVRAALQKVYNTKFRYDTLKARAHQARRR